MVLFKTSVRWLTNFSFLLALILTVFLLSGTTSTTPGVRNLYAVKIELNSTRAAGVIDLPGASIASDKARIISSTSPVLKQPTATLTLQSTFTVSVTRSAALTTSTGSFKAPTPAASKIPVGKRGDDGQPKALPRALASASGDDEGSVVLISYFGVCASNTTTGWSCTKKRHRAETLGGSPPKFLKLGGSLQGAISPLPPIIAVTLQGSLLILSCFLGFRSSAGLHTKLGKVFLVLSFAAFNASVFTAVLFQSAAGMIYSAFIASETMVVSKGSSGIALAWAGVFFTTLAMAGVILLALLADPPQETNNHVGGGLSLMSRLFDKGGQRERDIEMPPVRDTSVRRDGPSLMRNERRDPHPQRGNSRPVAPAHKVYSERVEGMRRGISPFGDRWNVI